MLLALVMCIVGLLMYLLLNSPSHSKAAEVGRIMFGVALLVLLWPIAGERLSLLPALPTGSNALLWPVLVAAIAIVLVVLLIVRSRPASKA